MRRFLILLTAGSLAVGSIVGVACKQKVETISPGDDDDDAGGNGQNPPNTGSGDDDDTQPATTNDAGETTAITGLPCDVEAVMQNNCTVCHLSGNPYDAGGTPPPLVTYDDLKMKSTADPTKTRAELAVEYMTAKTMPKPPAEPVDPDEITTVQSWIDAGYPKNPTACVEAKPDGGKIDLDGGVDDGGDAEADSGAYDGGCASGVFWTMNNTGSELMHPGGTCIACHTANAGPKYRFAGTVFTEPHEPNDCDGDGTPVTVTITDKNNTTASVTTNAAGNFGIDSTGLVAPFTVKLTQGTKTRAMTGTITAGDCNGCHTSATTGPGRVLAP